jgi:glycosyltransferase involved in cell wall biosynthesis
MRVLHLDSGRTLQGGQIQVIRLIEGLERLRVDQIVLARGELQRKLGAGPLDFATVFAQAGKADLIHAHDAQSHTWAALLGRGCPLVVSRRVAFPVKGGILSRLKYARADRYLAVSEAVKEKLLESGVAERRIIVVGDGIDPPTQEPVWTLPEATPRVAILDSADPLKRTAAAVEACRQAGLEAVVDRNLERALDHADYFLYLPQMEGFGSAILAAAIRKVPVVAAAVGGIPEVIADAETGLLTDGSVQQAAEALRRLANDSNLARGIAERAYSLITSCFSSDIMVDRTAEVYRSLLAS